MSKDQWAFLITNDSYTEHSNFSEGNKLSNDHMWEWRTKCTKIMNNLTLSYFCCESKILYSLWHHTYTASVKQFRNGHIYPVEQHATFLHSQKGQPGARSSCLHRVQGRVWADSCILKTDSIWYALPKRTRKYCGAAVGENTTNFLLNLLTWQYKCVFILAMQLGRTKMSASILSSRWARW
jgi:hypothetical protein